MQESQSEYFICILLYIFFSPLEYFTFNFLLLFQVQDWHQMSFKRHAVILGSLPISC